jgi:hypothetical protein
VRLHHALRVADLVLELAVADRVRRLLELARGVLLAATGFPRHALELTLQLGHLALHLALALHQAVHAPALLAGIRRAKLFVDVGRDLSLGLSQRLRRAHRVLHAAIEAALLLAF